MHEDIPVCDNSHFFLPAERFLTRAQTHFYSHYYFFISVQIVFHSSAASHPEHTKHRLSEES